MFFIYLKAAITTTGLVFPVALCTTGSYKLLASPFGYSIERTYIESHEDVVKLNVISRCMHVTKYSKTNLLITNSEFALGLLVGIGKGLELLDGLAL